MPTRRSRYASSIPNPTNWTFLLKHQRFTIVLHHPSTDTLFALREKLLKALRLASSASPLDAPLDPTSLPIDPRDVLFGVPIDNEDLSLGFMDLEISATGLGSALSKNSRAERRRTNDPRVSDISELESEPDLEHIEALNETPRMAGLRDNQVLAFSFRAKTGEEDVDMDGQDEGVRVAGSRRRVRKKLGGMADSTFEVAIMNPAGEGQDAADEMSGMMNGVG